MLHLAIMQNLILIYADTKKECATALLIMLSNLNGILDCFDCSIKVYQSRYQGICIQCYNIATIWLICITAFMYYCVSTKMVYDTLDLCNHLTCYS